MRKMYYNNEGFICNLYPYVAVTNDCNEFDVSEELYTTITCVPKYHAWKYINGQCECVDIRTEPEKQEALLHELRKRRDTECFDVVNRGTVWYSKLDSIQKEQLYAWYEAWLNVTATKVIPAKPAWLK